VSEQARELLYEEDVEAFNAWRRGNPEEPIVLDGEDLAGLDLSGAWLMGVSMRGTNFAHARLVHTIFSGATLDKADLHAADLTEASFGPPRLIEADLLQSPLGKSMLKGASCRSANFELATLTSTDFRESDLTDADFARSNHADASFDAAILSGANMPKDAATLEERTWGALKGLTSEQKKSYVQTLYAIACVDGDFDESEQAFLFSIATHMELTPEEFDACIPDGEMVLSDIVIDPPDDPELRVQWLRNIIVMIAADGVLAPAEYQTCLYFADQLGFPQQVVDEVLGVLSV
jgi:hypothetical protein